jgi:hypothetical protein
MPAVRRRSSQPDDVQEIIHCVHNFVSSVFEVYQIYCDALIAAGECTTS